MTDRGDLALLVARVNPVDDPHDVADSLDLRHELLSVIDERSTDMTSAKRAQQLGRPPRSARPVVAFAAALATLLLVIGASTLLLDRNAPIDEPADVAPTTVAPRPIADPETATTIPDAAQTTDPLDSSEASTILRWTPVNLPTSPGEDDGTAATIAYANGRFVAAGRGLFYSDDLATWSRVAEDSVVTVEGLIQPDVRLEAYTLAAGPTGFVAVWSGGEYVWEYGARGLAAVLSSEDGISWTRSEIHEADAMDSLTVNDLTAGGPGWVAVGGVGGNGRIWVSEDGVVWDAIALPDFTDLTFVDVSVHDGRLRAEAGPAGWEFGDDPPSGATLSWASDDGYAWTQLPTQTGDIGPVTHSISVNPDTGQHIALSLDGVWASDDGIAWREVHSDNGTPPYSHPTHGAVWLGETIIGVHRYTDTLFESTDGGTTWVRSHPFSHEDDHYLHALHIHEDVVIATVGGLWIGTDD